MKLSHINEVNHLIDLRDEIIARLVTLSESSGAVQLTFTEKHHRGPVDKFGVDFYKRLGQPDIAIDLPRMDTSDLWQRTIHHLEEMRDRVDVRLIELGVDLS